MSCFLYINEYYLFNTSIPSFVLLFLKCLRALFRCSVYSIKELDTLEVQKVSPSTNSF